MNNIIHRVSLVLELDRITPVADWLDNQKLKVGVDFKTKMIHVDQKHLTMNYYFADEKTAVLFKLTWGGSQ